MRRPCMRVDSDFIVQHLKDVHFYQQPCFLNAAFSIDSRQIQPGEVFVALLGEHVDGHAFIGQALQRGASGFIVALDKKEEVLKTYGHQLHDKAVLFVPDTQQAFLELAAAWRLQFTYPVVAITGTVGKTSTKEMVRNILRQARIQSLVSTGNQNTVLGVALNIFKMRPEHQVAVFELGIAQCGSMKKLVTLVKPTYSLITQVGHGHMQGLGDVTMIAREKRDVFSLFTARDIGVINGDQPELATVSYAHPIIRFGKKTINQIQARKIVIEHNMIHFTAVIYNKKYPVVLQTSNQVRVMNALAALAIGHLLNIAEDILIKGIEQPLTVPGRFEPILLSSGSIIINDAYNANPESVKASLRAFESYHTDKKKILVLGDMAELGTSSIFWHRQIGRIIRKMSTIAAVVLVGTEVVHIKKLLPFSMHCYHYQSLDEAYNFLKPLVSSHDTILLCKASHSMNFDRLIHQLQIIESRHT